MRQYDATLNCIACEMQEQVFIWHVLEHQRQLARKFFRVWQLQWSFCWGGFHQICSPITWDMFIDDNQNVLNTIRACSYFCTCGCGFTRYNMPSTLWDWHLPCCVRWSPKNGCSGSKLLNVSYFSMNGWLLESGFLGWAGAACQTCNVGCLPENAWVFLSQPRVAFCKHSEKETC